MIKYSDLYSTHHAAPLGRGGLRSKTESKSIILHYAFNFLTWSAGAHFLPKESKQNSQKGNHFKKS